MKTLRVPLWYLLVMTLLLAAAFALALFFGGRFTTGNHPNLTLCLNALSLLFLTYTAYLVFASFFYRPAPLREETSLPGCTVLLPAYNEGKGVADALESLLESDYPADRLEIIAINDGSEDDTACWIRKTMEQYPCRIKFLDFPVNAGKKHALCAGTREAKFDYIVTVDSDSVLEKTSLRRIVSAFNADDVGAVAGSVRVRNQEAGILPRMMDTAFLFGFEVIRTAQSLFGCVLCTPGALSAYRKDLILKYMDAWLSQTFLGVPAKIGEDRAIATMILAGGDRIVYERTALAWTNMPVRFSTFCKMLIRWTRSDVREDCLLLKYLLHETHLTKRVLTIWWHNTVQVLNLIFPVFILPSIAAMLIFADRNVLCTCFGVSMLSGLVLAGLPAVLYARTVSVKRSLWAVGFTFFSMFALSWIPVYSILTVRNTNWLTRKAGSNTGRKHLFLTTKTARIVRSFIIRTFHA